MAKRNRPKCEEASPGASTSTPDENPPSTISLPLEGACDPHRLAKVYLRRRSLSNDWALRFWQGNWWRWTGCKYVVVPESDLRAEITMDVKRELDRWADVASAAAEKTSTVKPVTASLVTNVLQALRGLVLVPARIDQPAWIGRSSGRPPVIAMENGLVDLERLLAGETDVLGRHSPDWFSSTCLDYPYDPDAQCPRFLAFLDQVFANDEKRISLSQEWFGYHLTPDTSLQKFLIGQGDGSNGKSVWVAALTALLGPENVSHVPLELFGERFQLTPTLGKLANICTEIGETSRMSEAVLKAFISGDRMYFDVKNQPGIQARPTARLTFTTNAELRFRDRSDGIWRRLIPLPFTVSIPDDQQDRELLAKLLAERSGIFNWSVVGLGRLRRHGRFTEPAICRSALDDYRKESNPARAFLLEHVCLRPLARTDCSSLYQQYRWACECNGDGALNERTFGKEIPRVFPAVRRVRGAALADGRRPWFYEGIALQDEPAGAPRPVPSRQKGAPVVGVPKSSSRKP